jgi:hypothetical protein
MCSTQSVNAINLKRVVWERGGKQFEFAMSSSVGHVTERSGTPVASNLTNQEIKMLEQSMTKKHVFISYCRDNKAEVARLREELIDTGEAVWWDGEILGGQDWKCEIRRAMKNSYAVVLCLSEELAHRVQSGVYPEVADAIAIYRQQAPGNIFLVPARLSDCTIPDIEIDDTQTLDRLQCIDLFPSANRTAGIQALLKALRASPNHP